MNIAEILKNCPKGIRLYSPIFGDIEFECIDSCGNIRCSDGDLYRRIFYPDGTYSEGGEVMLFPSKDQRDWSKFLIPFKNGDVIITTSQKNCGYKYENVAIFKKYKDKPYDNPLQTYCQFTATGEFDAFEQNLSAKDWRKATEEERKEFFEKLRQEGYEFVNYSLVKRFKRGDIVTSYNESYKCFNTGIFDQYIDNKHYRLLCVTHPEGISIIDKNYDISEGWLIAGTTLASTPEKIQFLAELAKVGYVWENDQLVKIIKPKFKVGDIITNDKGLEIEITSVENKYYCGVYFKTGLNFVFPIEKQDNYRLAKFDVTSLKPYDKVLIKDVDGDTWYPTLVSFVTDNCVYVINRDMPIYEVIPFEGHEHLIGLSEDPDKYYITWE